MEMKRIALIRNSYSYDVGGGEMFPINLSRLLPENGYEPVILSANKKTLEIAQNASIKTTRSPWWSFQNFSGIRVGLLPLYLLWMLFVIGWYLHYFTKNRIDVVHPQSRDDFVAATIAGQLLRKRVVWSDHADLKHIYANHRKWHKNPVGKLVYLIGLHASYVIIESNSERALIEKVLGHSTPSNYSVVYPGVMDTYRHASQGNKGCTFVSTSRLVEAKGILELIMAFQMLSLPDTQLKICGDGPDAARFREAAKGSPAIEFLGHVKDVSSILDTSDVFVHPTYHEGFGLSLAEAEMFGLPIVASNVGSIPEIVQDGLSGILVPPKSPQALADAMRRLADDAKLRSTMGKNGRKIYLEHFQFDEIVRDKMLPLYEQ
jgi:glycosyltransferase involved in cell wall biosynthesis